VLSDEERADRLLALTGARPVLAAVLEYLCAYEPDLIGAAEHLGVGPQVLADAAQVLSA
jgi:hypothetical protein